MAKIDHEDSGLWLPLRCADGQLPQLFLYGKVMHFIMGTNKQESAKMSEMDHWVISGAGADADK